MCFKGNSGNEGGPINLRSTNKQYGVDENEQRSVPALSIDVNIISDIATKTRYGNSGRRRYKPVF